MMERRIMIQAILNPLRRFQIKEPEILATLIADSLTDAASLVGLLSEGKAPSSPEDLGQNESDSYAKSNPAVIVPQPPLVTEPARGPVLVSSSDPAPAAVAIRPNRTGRPTAEMNIWEFNELLGAVTNGTPQQIDVPTGSGTVIMMRSIEHSQGAYGSGGFVKLTYSAGSVLTAENREAVSLGPISVSHTFTESDAKPLDMKFTMMDLTNKAAGIARTCRSGPVVSRNLPISTSQGEAFSQLMRDGQKPADQRQFAGNSEEV